jgi:hypothetical protein
VFPFFRGLKESPKIFMLSSYYYQAGIHPIKNPNAGLIIALYFKIYYGLVFNYTPNGKVILEFGVMSFELGKG